MSTSIPLTVYDVHGGPTLDYALHEIPERRMPPLPIVEELEVLEELGARCRPSGPGRVVDQLNLQRREKALGDGVVPAVAATAHTADGPRAEPGPAGSPRWRTDSRDPNDAASPAADAGGPAPRRGRRG